MPDLGLVLFCGFLGSLLLLGVAAYDDTMHWWRKR